MIPFFFGSSDRPIYGVYDPPKRSDVRRGIVVCNAVGPEYFRAHRSCRALARRLSDQGAHVLRFDYLGTGDSAGEVWDFRPRDWIDNVGQAVDELKDMTGLRTVGLVGLRVGAALAAAAAGGRRDVDRVVLWDPVREGEEYRIGRDYPVAFVEELLGLSWRTTNGGTSSLLVTTSSEAGLDEQDSALDVRHSPGPNAWVEQDGFGSGGIPVAALDEIVSWVTGAR